MAAKATLERSSNTTAIPFTALPSANDAQHLFQRVYTHLKDDQMPLAVALITQEGEKMNLNEASKKQILDGISPMALTPETRAEKFVSILKKFKDLFPGVNPEDFQRVKKQMHLSSASPSHGLEAIAALNQMDRDIFFQQLLLPFDIIIASIIGIPLLHQAHKEYIEAERAKIGPSSPADILLNAKLAKEDHKYSNKKENEKQS